jgi:hypothetical protein
MIHSIQALPVLLLAAMIVFIRLAMGRHSLMLFKTSRRPPPIHIGHTDEVIQ